MFCPSTYAGCLSDLKHQSLKLRPFYRILLSKSFFRFFVNSCVFLWLELDALRVRALCLFLATKKITNDTKFTAEKRDGHRRQSTIERCLGFQGHDRKIKSCDYAFSCRQIFLSNRVIDARLVCLLASRQFVAGGLFGIADVDSVANHYGMVPCLALDCRKLCEFDHFACVGSQ